MMQIIRYLHVAQSKNRMRLLSQSIYAILQNISTLYVISHTYYTYIYIWYNVFRSCQYTTVFGNVRFAVSCQSNMDENVLRERRRYVSPFSCLLFLRVPLLQFFVPFLHFAVSRGHSVVFGETGIASYFPEGCWVNSRSPRSQRAYRRSKCTSAIFGWEEREMKGEKEISTRAGRSTMGDRRGMVSQFPQSTRYERFPRANRSARFFYVARVVRPRC